MRIDEIKLKTKLFLDKNIRVFQEETICTVFIWLLILDLTSLL